MMRLGLVGICQQAERLCLARQIWDERKNCVLRRDEALLLGSVLFGRLPDVFGENKNHHP